MAVAPLRLLCDFQSCLAGDAGRGRALSYNAFRATTLSVFPTHLPLRLDGCMVTSDNYVSAQLSRPILLWL